MQLHRNAKLGCRGAFALVGAIEPDARSGRRRDAMASRLRPHVRGRGAGAKRPRRARVARLSTGSLERPHRCRLLTPAVQERICGGSAAAPAGVPVLLAGALRVPALRPFRRR